MKLHRRTLLSALGSAIALAPLGGYAARTPRAPARYLSARADLSGRYFLTGFDASGTLHFDLPLPGRGHAIAVHPVQPIAVQVARRPGRYLLVFNTTTGELLQRISAAPGRHFYGHGVFSPDGRWFYTTENDYENGRGCIGVRDCANGYRPVGEYSSGGIGPHELLLMPDGNTLAVANGGMQTHPDTGRSILNLQSMRPSLAYIDRRDGRLLEQHVLPQRLHKNSIRHLACNDRGSLCFIMQYQGSRRERPPLVGLHRRGETPQLLSAPAEIQKQMRNYCGSACADPSGQIFAVSSPKGGVITFWDAQRGDYLGHTKLEDGCGIAPGNEAGEFLLSSGLGTLLRYRIDGRRKSITKLASLEARWDNHMSIQTTFARGETQ